MRSKAPQIIPHARKARKFQMGNLIILWLEVRRRGRLHFPWSPAGEFHVWLYAGVLIMHDSLSRETLIWYKLSPLQGLLCMPLKLFIWDNSCRPENTRQGFIMMEWFCIITDNKWKILTLRFGELFCLEYEADFIFSLSLIVIYSPCWLNESGTLFIFCLRESPDAFMSQAVSDVFTDSSRPREIT